LQFSPRRGVGTGFDDALLDEIDCGQASELGEMRCLVDRIPSGHFG